MRKGPTFEIPFLECKSAKNAMEIMKTARKVIKTGHFLIQKSTFSIIVLPDVTAASTNQLPCQSTVVSTYLTLRNSEDFYSWCPLFVWNCKQLKTSQFYEKLTQNNEIVNYRHLACHKYWKQVIFYSFGDFVGYPNKRRIHNNSSDIAINKLTTTKHHFPLDLILNASYICVGASCGQSVVILRGFRSSAWKLLSQFGSPIVKVGRFL